MSCFAKGIRWKLLLGLALIACAGVVFWTVFLEPWRPTGPFWEKYQKVQLGMTDKEVIAILGPPDYDLAVGLGRSYLDWYEGRQTISVELDVYGRVTEKSFQPSHHLWWVHE